MAELLSAILTQQHRDVDAALEAVIAGQTAVADLRAALRVLRLHIRIEEDLLFGPLAAEMVMPVYIMKYEHAEIWARMDKLDMMGETDNMKAPCQQLCKLLSAHNRKEEDLVYAAVDRLAAAGTEGISPESVQAARLPSGWVCHGRRAGFAPPPGAPPWPPGGRLI